jgi:single-strand DNA-binding protein
MAKYRDINQVIVTGNLVEDPVDRYTSSGTCVASLKVAVNRGTRNGEDQGADFIPVTVWGKMGEACAQWLRKGSKVAVEGSIRTSSYDKGGQRHYKTEINAQQVLFLNTPSKQSRHDDDDDQYPTKHMQDKANGYQPEPDDGEEIDIPF